MDANGNPIPAFGVITRSTLGANEENKLSYTDIGRHIYM